MALTVADYRSSRELLLGRIKRALEEEPRVAAAWLGGSFGRGEDDAWSDFDLHVAVFDEHHDAFWRDRFELYGRVGSPVLVQQELASNAQPGGHFQLVVFDGPLEVDWNIGPLSRAAMPVNHTMLLQRAPVPLLQLAALPPEPAVELCESRLLFLWAMAPIVIKYSGRGATRRAVGVLNIMMDAFVILWRVVHTPDGPDPTITGQNRPLEAELSALLPKLGSTIDVDACLAALRHLCTETERLHTALTALGVRVPAAMPAQVAKLALMAAGEACPQPSAKH